MTNAKNFYRIILDDEDNAVSWLRTNSEIDFADVDANSIGLFGDWSAISSFTEALDRRHDTAIPAVSLFVGTMLVLPLKRIVDVGFGNGGDDDLKHLLLGRDAFSLSEIGIKLL